MYVLDLFELLLLYVQYSFMNQCFLEKERNKGSLKLCKICFSTIYRGSSHSKRNCHSSKIALSNVTKNILTKKSFREKYVTTIVREKLPSKTITLSEQNWPLKLAIIPPKVCATRNKLSIDDVINSSSLFRSIQKRSVFINRTISSDFATIEVEFFLFEDMV